MVGISSNKLSNNFLFSNNFNKFENKNSFASTFGINNRASLSSNANNKNQDYLMFFDNVPSRRHRQPAVNQATGLSYISCSTLSNGAQNVLNEIYTVASPLKFDMGGRTLRFVLLDDKGNKEDMHKFNGIEGSFGQRGPLYTTVTLTNSQLEKMSQCKDFKNQFMRHLQSEVNRLVAKNEKGNPNCDLTSKEMETYHMDFWKEDDFWNEYEIPNKDNTTPKDVNNNLNSLNKETYKSAINKYEANFSFLK